MNDTRSRRGTSITWVRNADGRRPHPAGHRSAVQRSNAYIGVFSKNPGEFMMGLAWNDGHTTIENTPIVDTQFGPYRNENDNIYQRTHEDVSVVTTPQNPRFYSVHSKFAYRTPWSLRRPIISLERRICWKAVFIPGNTSFMIGRRHANSRVTAIMLNQRTGPARMTAAAAKPRLC